MQQNFAANKRNKKISIIQRLEKSKRPKREANTHSISSTQHNEKSVFQRCNEAELDNLLNC
jgi:hypothetical protein